jgi:hypothetical protein
MKLFYSQIIYETINTQKKTRVFFVFLKVFYNFGFFRKSRENVLKKHFWKHKKTRVFWRAKIWSYLNCLTMNIAYPLCRGKQWNTNVGIH